MAILDFSPEDLAANGNGRMSKRQQIRLTNNRWKYCRGYALLAGVMTSIALVPAIRHLAASPALRDANDLLGFGFFMALALVLVALSVKRWQQITRDTATSAVETVSSAVSIVLTSQRMQAYKLKTIGKNFQVSARVATAFKPGASYRIFYTPRSEIILSAQELR